MARYFSPVVSRRHFLKLGGAVALAGVLPVGAHRAFATGSTVPVHRLSAAPGRSPLAGKGYPATAVYAYDGSVPGPLLRIPQGRAFEAQVDNRLGEDTTVHWHGIRLPNAMDGVPGLTQPPVKTGESFTHAFTPPDAGTFL